MKKKIQLDNKLIGQRIRQERNKFQLSQEEFAEIIGLSDYYIGQLERGERQMSLPVLVKIASSLHISLDYLVFGENSQYANGINETHTTYETHICTQHKEILELIEKCSPQELELFKKIIMTVLPYINQN